jgi:hypothetical protein
VIPTSVGVGADAADREDVDDPAGLVRAHPWNSELRQPRKAEDVHLELPAGFRFRVPDIAFAETGSILMPGRHVKGERSGNDGKDHRRHDDPLSD